MITKILLIFLIALIIKSILENFILPNFSRKEKQKDDSSNDIIDVDYEEID